MKELEKMEIPKEFVCNPFDKDGQHYGCPFRLDTNYCRAFARHIEVNTITTECYRCFECRSLFPYGGIVTIEANKETLNE